MICTVFARTRLPSLDAIVQTGLIYHLDEVLASGKDAKKSEVWQIPFTTPLPEPSQGCNLFNFLFFWWGGGGETITIDSGILDWLSVAFSSSLEGQISPSLFSLKALPPPP